MMCSLQFVHLMPAMTLVVPPCVKSFTDKIAIVNFEITALGESAIDAIYGGIDEDSLPHTAQFYDIDIFYSFAPPFLCFACVSRFLSRCTVRNANFLLERS